MRRLYATASGEVVYSVFYAFCLVCHYSVLYFVFVDIWPY
jgi:hypothetical protein